MNRSEVARPTSNDSRVDVTRIKHYARNPRRQKNPEYDRIKASIRAEGLDQPLVVTQMPDADGYVLHSGGNTRLRILHELLTETGDERYRWVPCVIVPWTQESSALFAHLRENDLRGGLPFIDKALAVFEAKTLLEQELCVDCLSQRQLEDVFRERGFSLSHSMISKMAYAVETLWPVMPKALAAGLGRPQVERLRALERAVKDVWSRHGLGAGDEFDQIFAELCRRYDAEDWDIQPLRDALEHELVEAAELNRHVMHLEVEATLMGRPFTVSVPAAEPEPSIVNQAVKTTAAETGTTPVVSKESKQQRAEPRKPPQELLVPDVTKFPNTVAALRAQLWQDAATLATRHGLGACVQAVSLGLGFLVIDVPSSELTETLDAEALGLVSAVWWQLAACAELTTAPLDVLLPHLDQASVLHEALSAHSAAALFNGVWTPDPAYLNGQLWHQLTAEDWPLWLRLMATYRTLKHRATELGLTLWAPDEDHRHVIQ